MQGKMTAQELYEELKLLSDQLLVYVDQFVFAQQYISALHAMIKHRVLMKRFSPLYKYHRIEVLVANALDVKMSIRMTMETENKHSVKSLKKVKHCSDKQKPQAP
jgi:hypothetical protein